MDRHASPLSRDIEPQRTRSYVRNIRQDSPEPQKVYVETKAEEPPDLPKDQKLPNWRQMNCHIEVDENNRLGKGSYGEVYPLKNDSSKVVKIVSVDISTAASTLVEACMLKSIRHPYLLSADKVILSSLCKDNSPPLKEIKIIMPRADIDSFQLTETSFMPMMKFLVPKSALGVKALHDAGFIHRDIKPENILVFDKEGTIKIADFGLSCLRIDGLSYSVNVQTLPYRAPELLRDQDCHYYTDKIDVYSLAITWLTILGRALFYYKPDKPEWRNLDYLNQLQQRRGKRVTASQLRREYRLETLNQIYDLDGMFNIHSIVRVLNVNPELKEEMAQSGISGELSTFIDLIQHMTHRDPSKRYSMQQVLESAYVRDYCTKDVIKQPVQFTAIPPYNTTFQNRDLWIKTLNRIFQLAKNVRQNGTDTTNILVRNIISSYAFELLLRSRQSAFNVPLQNDVSIAAAVYLSEMIVFPVSRHVTSASVDNSVVRSRDRGEIWFMLKQKIVAILQSVDFNIFSDTLWQKVLQENKANSDEISLKENLLKWAITRGKKD